jgi:hypothetical protein
MITYESSSSPFFEANKAHIETIEQQLVGLKVEFTGYCNGYGYDVEATFVKNQRTYSFRFIKGQTTHVGANFPRNAMDHYETVITVDGLIDAIPFSLGRSSLIRLFTAKTLPAPYFLHMKPIEDNRFTDRLVQMVKSYDPISMKQTNAQLTGKIRASLTNVLGMIEDLKFVCN